MFYSAVKKLKRTENVEKTPQTEFTRGALSCEVNSWALNTQI